MKGYVWNIGADVVPAEQWHEVTYDRKAGHGNEPQDMPIYHLDVGYYRRPEHEFSANHYCPCCGWMLETHGWMDSGGEGRVVCPGDFVVAGFPIKPETFRAFFQKSSKGV